MVHVYTLNAFAKAAHGGNPAGVVLDAGNLTETQMQAIAKEVGFSETAFVQASDSADYKVRFFTPKAEVDLCGHASIATFYLLSSEGFVSAGEYTQETKAGILQMSLDTQHGVYLEQPKAQFGDILPAETVLESLGLEALDLVPGLPIQIVSTGLRDIFIPVKDLKTLYKIQPNSRKISQVSKQYGVCGYHVFTDQTVFKATAHARNFAPLYDIEEEAATGTSTGALTAYLFKHGQLGDEKQQDLLFEQGFILGKPSEILTRLESSQGKIASLKIGDKAIATGGLKV